MIEWILNNHDGFEGFWIGPVYLHVWGLMVMTGILCAFYLVKHKVEILNLDVSTKIDKLFFILIIAIFIGSRSLSIWENWPYYSNNLIAILQIWQGGFSFFGGVTGALLAGYFWSLKTKNDFWLFASFFVPAWLVGLFCGRIGCFLIKDHPGVTGRIGNFNFDHQPALYEALGLLLIIGILTKLAKRIKPRQLFLISLLSYSVLRFGLDFLRAGVKVGGDERFANLTLGQWLILIFWSWIFFSPNRFPIAK